MNPLVLQIAKSVKDRTANKVRALPSRVSEMRTVFHGPPKEILQGVFEELIKDGGIKVAWRSDEIITVPVLLHSEADPNPPQIGESGICAGVHLNDFRNQPACPKFVALLAPGNNPNLALTIETASDSFGLDVRNNSGNATIEDWWNDDFIQYLVRTAIDRLSITDENSREQAIQMIRKSVYAADEAERHSVSRNGAWQILSRIYCIPLKAKVGPLLSLTCGFPPTSDGILATKSQDEVLQKLAVFLGENGITKGLEELKEGGTKEDAEALDGFAEHLLRRCDIPTTFGRAAPYFYEPALNEKLDEPPKWWCHLTLERWVELLQEEHSPDGALGVECINSIFPPLRGGHSVVHGKINLRVSKPEAFTGSVEAELIRSVSGRAHARNWKLTIHDEIDQTDSDLPPHKTPARYTVESGQHKKASIKVISLESWEPGYFVFCRNSKKITPPKQSQNRRCGVKYECTLLLEGSGRHYIDIYTRPSVQIGENALRHDDSSSEAEQGKSQVTKLDETTYGFEAEASGECHYDLTIKREGGEWENIRIYINCEEVSPEGCRTEFERLIKLNRQQENGRATTDVQIDRNIRCSDLQTWSLSKDNAEKSFYPLVISTDYGSSWRPPNWTTRSETVISSGKFLQDPRPSNADFRPPLKFIENRTWLAGKLRGSDDNCLIEAARLGEWLTVDEEFSGKLHAYLEAYYDWLEADPNIAPWADLIAFCDLELDQKTLRQEPDAIILSPLHPVRLAWQAVAQKALFLSYKHNKPCPAAGILDPDSIPDIIMLPILTASGAVINQAFLAVECSSDYWSILWNGKRLDSLPKLADKPPFDERFGVRIGGISSGFSLSQVRRSLDDVTEMLSAKPIFNLMLSSPCGQTNACNEGIYSWCKERLGTAHNHGMPSLGPKILQIFDLRDDKARPEEAEISNLAEDTLNAVRWFSGDHAGCTPDLGIIAQLETSNAREDRVDVGSPLGWGALLRHRVRRQLPAADGAFLSESRVCVAGPTTGDALADKLVRALAKLENMSDSKTGFSFAPSVHAIHQALGKADFVAVSSSAVDPACFLGNWLPGYLWDYDLPSYSHRAGDTNGYYLISQIKETDRDALKATLSKLPDSEKIAGTDVDAIILEVARRGIPTVRGLSSGSAGAAGDLGLFVASRLIQDSFRLKGEPNGLLPIIEENNEARIVSLIIPVDPFRGYLDDLQRALKLQQLLRPDLLVATIRLTASECLLKLTPVEVKYRTEIFSNVSCKEALAQASALSQTLSGLNKLGQNPELIIWKLAFHHLLSSMLSFAFRVYSQQRLASIQSKQWTEIHAAVIGSLLADEIKLQIDQIGRLIVLDSSTISGPRDVDGDSFQETLVLSPIDAASILTDEKPLIYDNIKNRLADWELLPKPVLVQRQDVLSPPGNNDKSEINKAIFSDAPITTQLQKDKSSPESNSTNFNQTNLSSSKPVEAPQKMDLKSRNASGVSFKIGETTDGFKKEPRFFNPSDTRLNQLNIGVVGDLGTGKTQLLKAMIWRLSNSAHYNRSICPRFLIFDYKKDYSDPEFVNAVGAKVVKPYHLPVNLFDISNSKESLTPWLDRFNFFSDVLDKIYSGIGPVQRKHLKTAVKQAYDLCLPNGRQPTIYDVNSCYSAIVGDKADSPSAILEDLVDREMFSPEPNIALDFEKFMNGVVVIDLASLGGDDRSKNMLVAVMLNMFYEHMLHIPKRPFEGVDPQLRAIDSFLLVDEADNIMRYEFDVLRKVLLQGREFGVGVILASQYLRHFKTGGSDYREPLLSWFIHKVPNVTPSELQALGLTSDVAQMAERVKILPNHCCLYKTFDVGGDVVFVDPFYQLIKVPMPDTSFES